MICFCSCTKSSYSPLQNLKQRESSKSCRSCGDKLPVDGRGAQQGSMLSNGGLELSNVIDPGLTWKKASNGRQRAVRRARTSFTGANGKNSSVKSLKVSKDLTDKNSKSTGDMPVSESEKVGVSILGRRFSDTVGSVPIKKRRFLLDHSRSPPHHSSLYSDDSGNVMERQTASYQGAMVNAKQHSLDVNSGFGSVFGQGRNFGLEKADHEGANEKICDAADFSGISILAAAACETNIGGELLNVDCSLSKVHPLEVQGVTKENAKLDFSPHEKEEAQPHTSEDLVGRTDLPFEISSSSALPSKESNEVKSDGSCNLETSVNSSQKVPNKITESSSRDVRFHWDLNTAADAWESHEEVLNSDREASHMSKDADHNDKLGNAEPFMDLVGFGDTKLESEDDSQLVDSRNNLGGEQKMICASEMKTEEKPGISNDNYPPGSKESKHLFSNDGDSPVEELHLTHAKTCVEDVCEETKSLSNKDQSCFLSGGVVSAVVAMESSLCDAVLEEGKAEGGKTEAHCVDFQSKVETENSPSRLVSCDDAIVDHPTSVSGSHHGIDKRYIGSGTDVQMEEIIHTSNPQDEKHEFLFVNPGAVETDGNSLSLVCHLAEKGSEVLADGNKCENMVTVSVISGANAHMNALDETCSDNANKSKEKDVCECETTDVEMKMDNTNAHNDDLDVAKYDFPSDDIGFEVSVCKLLDITPGDAVPQPALSSQGACKNNTDGSASNPAQVALENHLDSRYHTDASQNDADQAPGMERVEFLGDDDSQYEDGEFRESLANCWLDDGEEVEIERVDYGSDRDTDVCDAVSDFSSVNRQVNSVGLPDASHDTQYREVGMDSQNASRFFLNFTSLANVSDAGSGMRNAGTVTGGTGFQGNLRTSEKDSSEGNDVGDNGFFKEADGARRSNHSASFRKMSGWDRLPGGCRNSDNGVTNSRLGSINRNCNGSSSDPVDSINRAVGSSLRRDLSSRIERVQSSDISRRNDKSYVRSGRSNDHNGFNPQVERDRDDPRPIGRSGPSMHLQGRGRGDHWVDSSNQHGNNQHDSSGYYGSTSFSHHGSRNAAAAAVAKVESNGFVVAPDGTIVKAGGAGSAGHLTRRSVPSSQNPHCSPMGRGSPIERERPFGGPGPSREMSPDRPMFAGRGKPGRYGPGMDSTSHRERYRRPVPDGIIDSSSMHHTISRRNHSFSLPHRRPLHSSRSHSRSPSRSRTRSPHRWASPRGRGDSGMNGGPGLRRRSRSPNFKPDARMGRPRAGFGERIVSYASLSRNRTSPPHASRWIDGRKEAAEHFRDYEYRRCPGRSPPARVFSRGRRFDLMDSPGRLMPDEYCRPANLGRFPEFVSFGRGSRHAGKVDDRKEHGDRYEMLPSTRQYINDGNMKHLRYDDENGFMAQNPQPKSSEFQRRESPRAFNRSTERQLGDSPRRSKEEKGHIRNGRDGNHNANFKSFGVRDGDDNMDAQRRPL